MEPDYVRMALAAIVEHWPNDLSGLRLSAEPLVDRHAVAVTVAKPMEFVQIAVTREALTRRDPGLPRMIRRMALNLPA